MKTLAVTTPWSSPFIWSRFVENLGQMVAAFDRPGWSCDVFFGRGIDPASRHIDCCIQAQDAGCDAIVFVGADQIHPVDMLTRLVARHEETGGGVIVAAVPFRGYTEDQGMRPFQPIAWKLKQGAPVGEDIPAREMLELVEVGEGPPLERIAAAPTAVVLFPTYALDRLADPWFWEIRDNYTMQRLTDTDSPFVWRLGTEAGIPVWLDKTIKVKHLHTVAIDDTYQYRFPELAEGGAPCISWPW